MGFHQEISNGAKFVPRAGGGGMGVTSWPTGLRSPLDPGAAHSVGFAAC